MKAKTGWVEKHNNGRLISMVQVFYDRIKVKKTPRKNKKNPAPPAKHDESLYYMLDKKINFGQLELTGDSVFSAGEIIEIQFQVAHFNTKLRMLAKVLKTVSFIELKRVLFRGELKFAAVNKEDYDRIMALEADRLSREGERHSHAPSDQKPSHGQSGKLKLSFKQS